MPPISTTMESSGSYVRCRRSERLSNIIKSKIKASSKNEYPSSLKTRGKPYRKKFAGKEQSLSSNRRQSSELKNENTPRKRRRIMETDESSGLSSQMLQKKHVDFSALIKQILEQMSPDLDISIEAIDDLNIYLNYVLDRLSRSFLTNGLESSNPMTVKDIEMNLPYIVPGKLCKYCIVEGRRALITKGMNLDDLRAK